MDRWPQVVLIGEHFRAVNVGPALKVVRIRQAFGRPRVGNTNFHTGTSTFARVVTLKDLYFFQVAPTEIPTLWRRAFSIWWWAAEDLSQLVDPARECTRGFTLTYWTGTDGSPFNKMSTSCTLKRLRKCVKRNDSDMPLTTPSIFNDLSVWRSERISTKHGDYSCETISCWGPILVK